MSSKKHKPQATLLLILALFIFNSSLLIATVRYVSHSGSNTPPYTSWATAADSIMSAINISVFGDTIYVANETYYEKINMIDGLTLIGAGMDSCVIDTRGFTGTVWSIQTRNYCVLEGFRIISSDGFSSTGTAVFMQQSASTTVAKNKIESASIGIQHSNEKCLIEQNVMTNVDYGVYSDDYAGTPYAELIISQNSIQAANKCLFLYSPNYVRILINNNFLTAYENYSRGIEEYGISVDTVKIYNNLIIVNNNSGGGIATLHNIYSIINNYITGHPYTGIMAFESTVKNNIVTDCYYGIRRGWNNYPITMQYNNLWENQINYDNVIPDSTNLSVDPMVVNKNIQDFHLQMFSPLIDAGDPNILDVDGSRSDIGLFGGPYGEEYTYRDLAPKPPSNLTAEYDSGLVKLTWNKNTEADFYRYRVYRDTVPNFMYDTTKIIAVVADTFYYDSVPEKFLAGDYYYKITALDSAGHQSAPSEEVHVNITGIPEAPPVVVEHYQLLNNYPNPFNSNTVIPYRLKKAGYVKLYVYDIRGELVRTLINEYQSAGFYEVKFSPTGDEREKGEFGEDWWTGYNDDIATGIYIYQLMVRGEGDIPVFSDIKKMILLK